MFIIQRVLDVLKEDASLKEPEWDSMMEKGISHIMSNLFNALPYEKREVLIQLSFAQNFDEDLFKRLFPGRLFGMYRRWFRGTMFSTTLVPVADVQKKAVPATGVQKKSYSVQSGMKEAVLTYVRNLDPLIASECRKNLFEAKAAKLKSFLSKESVGAMENIGAELNSLLYYGTHFRDKLFYIRAMIDLRPVFFCSQGAGFYLEELREIVKQNMDAQEKGVMETVLLELAATELQMGQYEEAYESVKKGIGFAKASKDSVFLQQLTGIHMRLIHIYPQAADCDGDSVGLHWHGQKNTYGCLMKTGIISRTVITFRIRSPYVFSKLTNTGSARILMPPERA